MLQAHEHQFQLISLTEASLLLGINTQTARDWLWKNQFPVPTVKINGKRLVPVKLLKDYVEGLIQTSSQNISNIRPN